MSKLLGIAVVLGSLGIASAVQAGECSSGTSEVAAASAPAATAQRSAAVQGRRSYSYEPSGIARGYRMQATRAGLATRESGLLQRRRSATTVASRNCARNGVPDLVPARSELRLSNQHRFPWETIYVPAFDTHSCWRFCLRDGRLCPRQSATDAGHLLDHRSALPTLHAHCGVIT